MRRPSLPVCLLAEMRRIGKVSLSVERPRKRTSPLTSPRLSRHPKPRLPKFPCLNLRYVGFPNLQKNDLARSCVGRGSNLWESVPGHGGEWGEPTRVSCFFRPAPLVRMSDWEADQLTTTTPTRRKLNLPVPALICVYEAARWSTRPAAIQPRARATSSLGLISLVIR